MTDRVPRHFLYISFLFFLYSLVTPFVLTANQRGSSYPFISGDTFRDFADHVYDEQHVIFHPSVVKRGDVIFVKTDLLESFFQVHHRKIPFPYILISHNGDLPVPRGLDRYLDSKKLIAWFSTNVENFSHQKLIPIPIGLANKQWGHGNLEAVKKAISEKKVFSRDVLLYMNFRKNTHYSRNKVYDFFIKKPFIYHPPILPFKEYLSDLLRTIFVLSPRGNGLDCHRTWEALYLGAIPILKKSSLDPLFKDLPVVLISNWEEVSEEFLAKKLQEVSSRSDTNGHDLNKLYSDYWFDLINKKRNQL